MPVQDKQKQTILKAIGDLGRRVTPADVATKTGLPVLVVQQELNKVAFETGGNMQVGDKGDIVYSFHPGFTNSYLAKGVAAAFVVLGAKLAEVGFYLLRISFGIALIASLITIVVLLLLIAVIVSRGLGSGDDDDRGGGFPIFMPTGGFHFSFWDWMILRDLFLWDAMTRRPVQYYDYRRPTIRQRSRSNFLLNCFSFLFGDGDPNEGIDQKRWQVIAQVIKKNGNVVTAEQLAPYTGADPKDENAVLPVLVRFNGQPEVTPKGNIIYVFEAMQSTAADQDVHPPAYLQEFPWKFTNIPEGELLPVFIVAGLNVAGAWTVWNWFHNQPSLAHSRLMTLVIALVVYGTLFVTIPIVRTLLNSLRNKRIEIRNQKRYQHAELVAKPSDKLLNKLAEAQEFRGSRKITEKDVVYTTEKDALDQPDELSEKFTQKEFDASP
ncbi:MAG TPA: hypothetical protein V6D22_07045 [Candidatus Obscuribacterales bacterium]